MLMGMEGRKAARIRLADFYNQSLYSHWKFTEKAEYLRDLGALDESDPKRPMVIIPNYLSAPPNCLRATSLYAVCCPNECEDLMSHLEAKIARPTASVEDIIKLVAALASPTVKAHRKLPSALVRRLKDIAAHHGGTVNLHGRLFSQWMHHAFPHECPYPHEAGAINPQTADEWMKATGQDVVTSEAERRKIVEDACAVNSAAEAASDDGEDPELPWSHAEELLIKKHRPPSIMGSSNPGTQRALHGLFFLAALSVGNAALHKLQLSDRQKAKWKMCVFFGLLAVMAFMLDLLDKRVFLVAIVGGLVFVGAVYPRLRPEAPVSFGVDNTWIAEKCCV